MCEKLKFTKRKRENIDRKFSHIILSLAMVFFCLSVILAFAWWSAYKAKNKLDFQKLAPDQLQVLSNQILDRSPGVFRYASFDPNIGYTLKANAQITCYGDTFWSNGLGYRTKPVEKGENVLRVAFVGDSWTYGMGVSEQDSFPIQFEIIANQYSGVKKTIEAWTLALPGYNNINQLAALNAFFDEIKPDIVVLCPTNNDIDSTLSVSPQGRFLKCADVEGRFFSVKWNLINSYLYRTLWKETFARIRQLELRLRKKAIPFFLFFVATWREAMIHYYILNSNIHSPYTILPITYCHGKWRYPPEKWSHGTPAAYVIFAKIVYQMVSENLGWNRLPEKVTGPDGSSVLNYKKTPPGNWEARFIHIANYQTRIIPEIFVPGSSDTRLQCWGMMDWGSGTMARSTVILLKRKPNSSQLTISIKRMPRFRFIYPMELHISIPSPSGGQSLLAELPERGDDILRFTIPIPPDIMVGSAIDVLMQAPRTAVTSDFRSITMQIIRIEQN